MKTIMDMSSCEIELDTTEIEYEEEFLLPDWSADVELVCGMPESETSTNASGVISELCLRKMYSYQQ